MKKPKLYHEIRDPLHVFIRLLTCLGVPDVLVTRPALRLFYPTSPPALRGQFGDTGLPSHSYETVYERAAVCSSDGREKVRFPG